MHRLTGMIWRRHRAPIASLALLACSLLGSGAAPSPARADEPAFTDIGGSGFQKEILFLRDAGITQGCNPPDQDRFCPTDPVTRQQMASFLARGLYLAPTSTNYFVDDEGSPHEADINRLRQAEITFGCNPPVQDRYCPGDTVTRQQMASFIARALKLPTTTNDHFVDDGPPHEADINRMREAGITNGCNPPALDRFCPSNPVTREQMAAFLYRALTVKLEPLPERFGTAASAVAYLLGDTDIEIPASCGGTPEVNCPNGNPISPGPQLSLDGIEQSVVISADGYAFTVSLSVVSIQDIPVSLFGLDCNLEVDTAPGASTTIDVNGTVDFAPYDADGPEGTRWEPSTVLNRVVLRDVSVTGLEDDDFTIAEPGGGFGFCDGVDWGSGFVTDLLELALADYAGDAAPCGAAGPVLFITCPTIPYVGVPVPGTPPVERIIVINEVDYDQPGSDVGGFIELRNNGSAEVDLAGLALVLVGGSTATEYARGNLTGTLAAGAYHVVEIDPQNGPDGVAVVDTATGNLIDALSYEGALTEVTIDGNTYSLVEGASPSAATDSNTATGSLIRDPDGQDTDDAVSDWAFTTITTPGLPNIRLTPPPAGP